MEAPRRSGLHDETPVNTASRLATAAGAGQIVASERVAALAVDAGIRTRALGALRLKGVESPVPAFEITPEDDPPP